MPPVETAIPTAASRPGRSAPAPSSRGAAAATPPPAEPTRPATLQPFEDGRPPRSRLRSPRPRRGPAAGRGPRPAGERRSPRPGKFWVQVASLSSHDEAGALSSRLARRGFKSQILTAAGPKGKGKVYRVRVGPYRTEDDADRAAGKLAKQENVKSPWVVPDGK